MMDRRGEAPAAPEPIVDGDWSRGPWEASCHTRLVRQRLKYDCGVACVAMVTGSTYEHTFATFKRIGLDRKGKPFSTTFKELIQAICLQATARGFSVTASVRRWKDWDAFDGLGILKVANGTASTRNWHWVVAERHPVYGVIVRDPAFALAGIERPPMDTAHCDVERIKPYGNWIRLEVSTVGDA